MATASAFQQVKYICGMIASDAALLERAVDPLTKAFGPVDLLSEIMDFDFTHYYDAQMGSPLRRRFVSFANLAGPDALAGAKAATNAMEADFAAAAGGAARPINLDVGYIEQSKLVLASMKNFSHRIALSGGAYAEITLMWKKDRWHALPWTFPDYASGRYDDFLTACRRRLREQLGMEGRP